MRPGQKGGNIWFYSSGVKGGSRKITHITLDNIDNAVMFNPFNNNAVVPTYPSTGILPNSLYYLKSQTSQTGSGHDWLGWHGWLGRSRKPSHKSKSKRKHCKICKK
jgi:hypothetical protein